MSDAESVETLEAERDYLREQVVKLQRVAEEAAERVAAARLALSRLSGEGRRGNFADRDVYEAAKIAVTEAGLDHQRALKASGKVGRALKELEHNLRMRATKSPEERAARTFYEHFVRVAKSLLPRETFDIIAAAAENAERMSGDSKARELTGAVLPALASAGGFKARKTERSA